MTYQHQFVANDAPHRSAATGAGTVIPVGRSRFPISPRMVSSSRRGIALTMRNLGASFAHFLSRLMRGKLSLTARRATSAKICASVIPTVSIAIFVLSLVTITGNHNQCDKSGDLISETGKTQTGNV